MARLGPGFAAVVLGAGLVASGCGGDGGTRPVRDPVPSATAPSTEPPTEPSGERTVRAGDEFVLAPGGAARLPDGFSVRFAGVREDGRCPAAVQCVWEGDATVTVEVTAAGAAPVARELHTSRRFVTETTVDGRVVRLLDLAPAARQGGVPAAEYRARLTVR